MLLFKILSYVEGAVFLYTNLVASAALFPSENISILVISFVTLKSILLKGGKQQMDLKKIQIPILY